MTTLYVDRKNADVELDGDTLVIRVDGVRHGTAPLRSLERVVLRGTSKISTRAITKLAERGIALLLLSGRKNAPAAMLTAPSAGDSSLRISQYELMKDETARQWLSAGLVRTKVASQMQLLSRQDASKPIRDAIATMNTVSERLESRNPSPPRTQLRGIEGAAAAAYFKGFTTLFPAALDFTSRNRRPPRDPVNVCLSLGYTLLHAETVRICASAGLDPMLGIYHDIAPGRESLACDLAEPVRTLVDRWTLRLFGEGLLNRDHFSLNGRDYACRLGKTGREIVYRSFEEDAPLMRRVLSRSTKALVDEIRAREPVALPSARQKPE